jgi:hypothetical protein
MPTPRNAQIAIFATFGLAAALLAAVPANATKPPPGTSTGTASVFKVNPVQSSGDENLTDDNDSATAVPASEYATVPLRNLDGTGYLTGKWVNVQSSTGTPAYSATNTFVYDRHADQFEQVMAYFWINQAQEYLQSLGFGSTLRPVNAQQQQVKVDQFGGDNSYQTDKPFRIRTARAVSMTPRMPK